MRETSVKKRKQSDDTRCINNKKHANWKEELNICLLQRGVVIVFRRGGKKQENETVTDGSALGQQKISDMFCTFSAFTCLFSFRKKKL